MAAGTLERVVADVAGALRQLEGRLQLDNLVGFFEQLGTRFPATISTNGAVTAPVNTAAGAAGALSGLLDDFNSADSSGDTIGMIAISAQLSAQIGTVLSALDDIAGAVAANAGDFAPLTPTEVLDFTSNFRRRVLDDRLIFTLETSRQEFVSAAVLLGLIDRFEVPVAGGDEDGPPVFKRELRLDRLGAALRGGTYFEDLMGWGSSPSEILLLLQRIEAFLNVFSANTVIDTTVMPPVLHAGGMSIRLNDGPSPPGVELETAFALPQGFSRSIPVGEGYSVEISTVGGFDAGSSLTFSPPANLSSTESIEVRFMSRLARTPLAPSTSFVLFGQTGASRVEAQEIGLSVGFQLSPGSGGAAGNFFTEFAIEGGKAVIDFSEGDGFLTSLAGGGRTEANFDVRAEYSPGKGLEFHGGAVLTIILPLNVTFGALKVTAFGIQLPLGAPGRAPLPIDIFATVSAQVGPVSAVIDGVGLETDVSFDGGNLGFGDIALGFRAPSGVGISVDAGVVRGGGFLSFEENRYFGAVELSVFGIAVKAFGLIETVLPDGSKGFSFAIIISAEFTPIQLGFGFTLLGVGGLVGIHRTVNVDALGTAARTGSLAHLLFPRNVVQDAPAIVHDLATVFPAARDHYIFGPMAKFGWGTPTLITGSFGVLIEFPGPRLGLIGVVRMQLPDPKAAILSLQMAISGFLDFPAKLLSVDAGLFDSFVAGFAVAGDMAYRLGFGNNAKFLMSVGGFNPDFDGPAGFPVLRRASVELGVNGNPSLTASGYFALTSNTAQIGARVDLRASGFGIRLTGWLGFDALFVFSPFSFTASFSAGMRVSFHGAGLGVTLRGTLKGTNPWMISGKVCVSVLFWDACLSVDHTFGNRNAAALPEINPWEGSDSEDPRLQVVGMRAAVSDERNWFGTNPPAGFSVVSLAQAATEGATPIDPLGAATLRQRVAPLGEVLTKFGEYKPIIYNEFVVESVKFDEQEVLSRVDVEDDFAPAHFFELSNAERLSTESYQKMRAGFTVDPERTTVGSADSTSVDYETDFITVDGDFVHDDVVYRPSPLLLAGLLKNLGKQRGVRQGGARKFITPNKARKVTFGPARYLVVDSCTSEANMSILGTETTQIAALLALRAHVSANPTDFNRYQVAPKFAVPTMIP